jgi:uncharacterized protein
MKLHLDNIPGYRIKAYHMGSVKINDQTYTHNMIVMPEQIMAWQVETFQDLTSEDFQILLACQPELVLLGTGQRQQFPSNALFAQLINAGIGVEVMDTQAACRTYNIVAAEGRQVAAALLLR